MLPSGLEKRLRDRLARLEFDGLRRHLLPVTGVDFCSNDYLGLSQHPALKQRLIEAIEQYGCGATGSRLIRGNNERFVAIEERFALFKGTEGALYFSSGYLANLASLTTFLEPDDVVFSNRLNHASLIDGIRLSRARCVVYPHGDVDALETLIKKEAGPGQRFLVTESLFSMDGDEAPLEHYASLCRATETALIIDEAHAVGLYGPSGSGLIEQAGIARDVFLSINAAGKALGVAGAFVAGSDIAIEYLVQRARPFIFSTAAPPAIAAAIDASLTLVAEEPDRRVRVLSNARLLRQLCSEYGLIISPGNSQIIPLLLGDNQLALEVAGSLRNDGFDVRAIRPPTVPNGSSRLRITVNSNHDESILRSFASACSTLSDKLQLVDKGKVRIAKR